MMFRKRLVYDYKQVFETEAGLRVLADLRKRCPLMSDAINPSGGIDVNKLIFLEGQRSVLLHIFKMLQKDPNEEVQEQAVGA